MECSYGCLSNFDLPPPESPSGRNKLTVPIGWFRPAGGLKDSMAWVPMLTDRHGTARPNDYVSVVTPTGNTV